jgi:hypothetical protein
MARRGEQDGVKRVWVEIYNLLLGHMQQLVNWPKTIVDEIELV